MANRNWLSGGNVYSMYKGPCLVTCKITIGSSGAVTSFTSDSLISGVTLSSTGVYVIALADVYQGLITSKASMRSPVSGLSGIIAVETQNAPSASVSTFASPTLTITTLGTAGTAANPASGSVIDLMMILSNSSVVA